MNKPIIAIFCVGNLPTVEETNLIHSLSMYPCVILNAETYTPQESLVVDAVVGAVPKQFANYPTPDEVIAKYEQYLAGTGDNVGGNPPTPPSNKRNGKTQPTSPAPVAPSTGFGNPPTPPQQ